MMGHLGMLICLPYFQFVSPLIGGLKLGPIFMCVLMCLCFLAAYKYEIHRDAQLDFSGTAQKELMCLRQTTALVGPVGLTTLQKEAVTVWATLHKE